MLYYYPPQTRARVLRDYDAEFADPIEVTAGEALTPDPSRHDATFGWIWCDGPDGRGGFTPEAWIDRNQQPWRIIRDYTARELSVVAGETIVLYYGESGWAWGRNAAGATGWVPDFILELEDA